MKKEEVLLLFEENQYSEVFKALSKKNIDKTKINRLRNEFIKKGASDVDFDERLKTLIDVIFEKTDSPCRCP